MHEQALRTLAQELGFVFISLSAELSQTVSFYGRAQTTAVNAYLAPAIHGYVERIRTAAHDCPLQVMTSAGGLVRAQDFRPLDSLLSGPAGGCVGAAAIGRQCGCERVIGFDMGGTSTDVARYDQGFDYSYELQVQDATVFSPALRIETVAAGGGSICGFDGYKLTVGPESARADPGPACYGAGGPLCVTDVNVLAGHLDPGSFGIPVYPEQAQKALEQRARDIHSAAVIEDGWELEVHASGTAILHDRNVMRSLTVANEPAALELYANRFMHIADAMGALLQRTACSVNVKERLDFSCAILDAEGHLVANAHHIPVHLGGLGLCARRILANHDLEAGDTIMTNHPVLGGSHLPDITLLTPACLPDGRRIGLVICRAHHTEIGGVTPGSMPPEAHCLAEEGVLIEPFYLLRKGQADWSGMRRILSSGPYASRMIQENLADLNAQLAANQQGVSDLQKLAAAVGLDTVQHYFAGIRENAAGKVRALFQRLGQGQMQATEALDDGSQLTVN